MKRHLFILFLFIFLLFQSVFSQQKYTISQLKAAYIFTFGKYITWENEDKIDEYIIGIVGSNTEVYSELNNMTKNEKLKGKSISILYFRHINNITPTHILYISNDMNPFFNQIYNKVRVNNTLIVTDNYLTEKSMINFIYNKPKRSFELNDKKIVMGRLIISPKLAEYSKIKTNWQELYIKSEKQLETEKEKVKIQQNEILTKEKKVDSIMTELDKQKRQIEFQSSILKDQKHDIVMQNKHIEDQKSVLNKQLAQINYQKAILYIIIALFILILASAIYIFRLYKNKRKLIKKLEETNIAIHEQKKEIEKQNVELSNVFKRNKEQQVLLTKALNQIRKQKDELEVAYEKIQETTKLKELFLANTSHEIRTPLNAILGFTNLLINLASDKKQIEYLNFIKRSGNHLSILINDILDFSKIEEGKLTFDKIDFNIREFMSDLVNTLNIKAMEKEIHLTYWMDEKIPNLLVGDTTRLNQILVNLIDNALKFTPKEGRVSIFTEMKKNFEESVEIQFRISDTGIGIQQEKISVIFNSFTQAESSITRRYGGTGLGLSIVKKLIDLQKGSISVESEIDAGTTFTFILRFEKSKLQFLDNKPLLDQYLHYELPVKNISILLVEDNVVNQQLAVDTLQTWNPEIKIDIASNGQEAINMMERRYYHLILMDMQMPVMDGYEATLYIRNEMKFPKNKTPIIALTAHAMQQEKEKCLNAGMNDYISKPFEPSELFGKIKKYLLEIITGETEKSTGNVTEKTIKIPVSIETTKEKMATHSYLLPEKQLKYVDMTYLYKLYKGKTNMIVKFIELSMTTMSEEIEKIKKHMLNNQWNEVQSLAHILKPKMLYLGLKELHECAKTIEILAKEKTQTEKIPALISQIDQTWQFAKAELVGLSESLK